jgi:hypothetical protein
MAGRHHHSGCPRNLRPIATPSGPPSGASAAASLLRRTIHRWSKTADPARAGRHAKIHAGPRCTAWRRLRIIHTMCVTHIHGGWWCGCRQRTSSKSCGNLADKALTWPVTITQNGRDRRVVMAVAEYERLKRRDRRARRAEDLTDEAIALIAAAEVPAEYAYLDDEPHSRRQAPVRGIVLGNLLVPARATGQAAKCKRPRTEARDRRLKASTEDRRLPISATAPGSPAAAAPRCW